MQIRLDRERVAPLEWDETLVFNDLEHDLLRDLTPVTCRGLVVATEAGFVVEVSRFGDF